MSTGTARRRPMSLGTPFRYLAAVLVVGITVVPLLFTVLGGARTNAQINTHPAGIPDPVVTTNYTAVFTSAIFWQALGNSLLIAVVATLLVLVCGSMAGYALSRFSFTGRDAIYTAFTLGLLFPVS